MTVPLLQGTRLVVKPERSCYTCRFSPPYPGPAGCSELCGDYDHDEPIIAYCVASGAADNDGWPVDRTLDCPGWGSR
jgi:hypothetical protein